MSDFTLEELNKTFKKLEIIRGDSIYLVTELFRLGKLQGIVDGFTFYKTFIDEILKHIGPKGTLSMNTYTFDNSRKNKNFYDTNKKCTSGKMSEIFLSYKNIKRSLHPLFSVTSIGKHKKYVCGDNSSTNYGHNSPYQRLLELNTKILCLGPKFVDKLSPVSISPFLHCAEFYSGVPYHYNKIFKKKVFENNKLVKKDFTAFVRYLNLDFDYDLDKIDKLVEHTKIVKKHKIGRGYISICNSKTFFDVICGILKDDIHGLLYKRPRYKLNQFPYL